MQARGFAVMQALYSREASQQADGAPESTAVRQAGAASGSEISMLPPSPTAATGQRKRRKRALQPVLELESEQQPTADRAAAHGSDAGAQDKVKKPRSSVNTARPKIGTAAAGSNRQAVTTGRAAGSGQDTCSRVSSMYRELGELKAAADMPAELHGAVAKAEQALLQGLKQLKAKRVAQLRALEADGI